MASPVKQPDNLNVLEEIYHEVDSKNAPKKSVHDSIIGYLKENPKRVDGFLSLVVIFFGLVAIIWGWSRFQYGLISYRLPKPGDAVKLLTASQPPPQDLLGLKGKDTDNDGLSDYDEIYIYGTSPYLPDSDSDGIPDKTEIANHTDPTCALNNNCFSLTALNAVNPADRSDATSLTFDAKTETIKLRQALLNSGMSQSDLDQLNDADLLAAYNEVIAGQAGSTTATIPSNVEDLTPDQIRAVLKTAGVSDSVLKNISDSDLMSLVKQLPTSTPPTN
ncbi:MAG: hypothetical protein PHW95_02820 [Patescibacteria group bacterium]|nr:hypothetical protein [Patescibacteria group bacterium]